MPGRLSAAGARLAVARAPRGSVRLAAGVLVIAAVAVGELARRSGTDLGAPRAPFFLSPPLFAAHHPLWPLPTLALALAVGVALARAPGLPGWLFLGSAFALALGARLGLAVAQRGVREWWWPLVRPGARDTEYPAASHLVAHDPLRFIDRFAQLVPSLPVHPAGHPAGA